MTPEALVASVITAKPGPFNGTVTVDNELGLPALPNAPQLGNGTQTARVWSNGDGKGQHRAVETVERLIGLVNPSARALVSVRGAAKTSDLCRPPSNSP